MKRLQIVAVWRLNHIAVKQVIRIAGRCGAFSRHHANGLFSKKWQKKNKNAVLEKNKKVMILKIKDFYLSL